MKVVELDRVTKKFGSVQALKGISFDVRRGQVVSLLGPSGCGKTTTLRLIAGFESCDSGAILISGKSMRGLKPYERNVGLVFQDYALFPHMTVAENLTFGMRHRGIPYADIPRRTQQYLELVRLPHLAGRYPAQLSGGEQQRTALARALAIEPQVLLLDEPLSALDAKLRLELRLELKSILQLANCTTIIVTHDQEEAMSLAEEVIVINHGQIEQRGSPAAVYDTPRSRFVAEFVGRSNWFAGELRQSTESDLRSFETDDGLTLWVAGGNRRPGKYEICLRPERLQIVKNGSAGGGDCDNLLAGVVRDVVYLGADINLDVELHNGKLVTVVAKNAGTRVSKGEAVMLGFLASDSILIP